MAELKVHEFPYELESDIVQAVEPQPLPTPDRPEVVVIPASPARRLNHITKLEKMIVGVLIVVGIMFGLLMINLRTTISQVEQDISRIQVGVTANQATVSQLEQERNELSRSERIKQIAEEQGLSLNSENLRKVK